MICLLIVTVGTVNVIDIATSFNNFSCFKQLGYDHSIIRAYHSYGAIDIAATNNIKLSNAAGLSTDVYMFPCRGKTAQEQALQLIQYLNMQQKSEYSLYEYAVGTIWLDIETNPSPGCSWSTFSVQANCQYLQALVKAFENAGRAVGIYASGYMWNQIFGSK